MAKYKGHPYYSVHIDDKKSVRFDHNGNYETSNAKETAALDALVPRYFARVDEPKQPKPKAEPAKPKASAE